MTVIDTLSAECHVQVAGSPLNPLVAKLLVSAEVDTSLFVPSQFRLAFRGSREDVLLGGGFQIGALVTITVTTGNQPVPLLTDAEVTAVEVDYGPGGNLTVVRGLDASHRLMRGTRVMAYVDQLASEIVGQLVEAAGCPVGEITPTDHVYQTLTQANVSPWVFIQQLAALENRVAYVDSLGLFRFEPMPRPEEAPPPVLGYSEPAHGSQLVMGKNLVRLRANVGAAEQVPAVTVPGYDPSSATPVVGLAPAAPSTSISLDPATLPPVVAVEVGGLPFNDSSRPFDSEGAARTRAQSVAADIAGALAEMEGECLGNPRVLAGKVISLGMAGPPFDGQYVVSSARHVFDYAGGGYSTWFSVGGRRDRSLYALAGGSGVSSGGSRPTIPGVVTGKVVDNMDPAGLGRVKVMFPWLGPSYVSPWARTAQMGASEMGGCLWLPEVGDEVLVAFDRGDPNYPYMIGNLYNGVAKPDPRPQVEGEVMSRRLSSRSLHTIQFNDGPEKLGITIQTGPQPACRIDLDAAEQTVTITAGEAVTVTLGGPETQVSIQASGQATLQAAEGITLKSAGPLQIQAGAEVSIEAAGALSLQGSEVSISGATISLGA